MFCLETCLGQLTNKGAPGAFAVCFNYNPITLVMNELGKLITILSQAMHPIFRGIGFAAMVVDLICSYYYNSIIMWILRYFLSSFTFG